MVDSRLGLIPLCSPGYLIVRVRILISRAQKEECNDWALPEDGSLFYNCGDSYVTDELSLFHHDMDVQSSLVLVSETSQCLKNFAVGALIFYQPQNVPLGSWTLNTEFCINIFVLLILFILRESERDQQNLRLRSQSISRKWQFRAMLSPGKTVSGLYEVIHAKNQALR